MSAWRDDIEPRSRAATAAFAVKGALAVYFALQDSPLDDAALRRVAGADADAAIAALEDAGLAARAPQGPWTATARHLRSSDEPDVGARVPYGEAVLEVAASIVADGRRSLDAWGEEARAGIGIVTLPDDPDVLPEITDILAEAEDRLRALALRHATGEAAPRLRVTFLVTSTDERYA